MNIAIDNLIAKELLYSDFVAVFSKLVVAMMILVKIKLSKGTNIPINLDIPLTMN